jgi:hypothetical protein
MSGTSSNMTKIFVIMTRSFVTVKNNYNIKTNCRVSGRKFGRFYT